MTALRCLRIREDSDRAEGVTVDDDHLAEAIRAETVDIVRIAVRNVDYVAVCDDNGAIVPAGGRPVTAIIQFVRRGMAKPALCGDLLIALEHGGELASLTDWDVGLLTDRVVPMCIPPAAADRAVLCLEAGR